MKKTNWDWDKLVKKYQPLVKETGEKLAKALNAAEKDVTKMYKIAQTHVEIQMKNLEKEKLYYQLGKFVADKLMKGDLDIASLERYKESLEKVSTEGEKIKNKLSRIK